MAQEEKSEEQSRDVSGNMADREDYLESLLIDAFKGKGFQKIHELLEEGEVEPPQKYNKSLFNQLDKALRKELDKNEFGNVSLLLKCIQLYLKSDLQEGKSLFIEQGLVAKMVTWFERARTFLNLIDPKENKFLMLLFEDFFDSALVICKCSNEGKKDLVNLFLPELGHLVADANLCCALHLEALRTLNSILDGLPREERRKFPLSEEMCSLTKDLAKTILEVGDYDLQVALSEALCRLMIKKWRDDLVHHWFEDKYLAEAFKEIKDREFETDCRKFLNLLNERLGDKRRVYSFPCISAFADMNEVKKPSDEKLEEFWIDFNTGSQSVTFYVDCNEGPLWDSVRLSKEAVNCYSLEEEGKQKIVKIFMKIPAALNKTEATKFRLVFSAEFEILSVLRKVLGDEKMMAVESEEETAHSGKQAMKNKAETPMSSNTQRTEDPSNSGNAETPKDNLTLQPRRHLTGAVAKMANSGAAMVEVSQQTDLEDANQGKKSKTPSPRMTVKPGEKPLEEEPMDESTSKVVTRKRRSRKTSSAKKSAEGRKEVYDFENSDSSSHEKVTEAKGKILAQNSSQKNQRTYETRSKSKESNSLEKRQSSYRKRLFSESNNENTSSDQSEKSWILDFQTRFVRKSVDYTRKKPRVRSKLKVLPVSSASGGSDYESKKQEESRQGAQKEMLSKKSTFSSKGDDLPIVDLTGETASEEPGGSPLLLNVPTRSYSSDVEQATQKSHGTPGKLSRGEESTKRKDSDMLSDTIVKKLKFSALEKNHSPSESNHTPNKIFDSTKEEAETQKGQEMDSVDVSFAKMLHEDQSDSEMVAAFESSVGQLKKLLWSRYKKLEISMQNVMRCSQKALSDLLYQIHECRMKSFEDFQKNVFEELANVEKDMQFLATVEKDVLDFWNAQLLRLSIFYNHQKRRMELFDSVLGELAKSSANIVQNRTHEHSVKKAEENN